LRGLSELLLDGAYGELNQEQRKQLLLMAQATSHLGEMIDAIAGAAKVHRTPRKEPMYFRNIVRRTVDSLQYEIRNKQVRVRESYAGAELQIAGDPDRLQAVVQNLLHNAIKYSRPGGLIHVVLSSVGEELFFEVRDHGRGIEKEELARIWERGYRSEAIRASDIPGLGLGLCIVKDVIEERGGKVEVHSAPGHGTRFRLRFPAEPVRPKVLTGADAIA
jgi:signal transduction histidine kinase